MSRSTSLRSTSQLMKISMLAGLIALGASSTIASAAGPRGGGHHHTDSCGCEIVSFAGRITIDGRTTAIRSDRSATRQIAAAFRKSGYRAWIDDGQVRVDYGRCKPVVRWQTDRYGVCLSWRYGELRVSLQKARVAPIRETRRHRPIRTVRPVLQVRRWGRCG